MSSRSLGVLSVDLVAKIGGFVAGMSKAERETQKSTKAMERRFKETTAAAKKFGIALGAAFVAAGTAAAVAIKSAIDDADELSKAAQKIGITTESLSTLGYAAKLADVDLGQLQAGLLRLTRFQDGAAAGTEKNIELFNRLGIEFQNMDGTLRDTDEVFRDFAERLSQMPDGADKSAIALRAFGKSGADLIPLLNSGAEGIEELEDRARRLGLELSGGAGKNAEELNDRLSDLWSVFDGLAYSVVENLLPDIIDLTEELAQTIREGGGMVEVGKDIADIFRGMARVVRGADLAIEAMGERFNIAGQYKNALLDPMGWATYSANIDAATGRLAELAKQNEALAKEARINFGIDPGVNEPGGRIEFIDPPAGKKGRRGIPMIDGATEVIYAGDDFGTGTGGGGRSASDRAGAEASRAAAEAARELEERIQDATRAQADFLKTTEDLRAEIGGPLAEVTLDYVRREDELIELAKLAGLSNEELAESLEILEQARLRDVAAIDAQAAAEAQRAREAADQPLIDQMDSLRDTTQGFFVDLVKNGSEAIDRLQDYLLTSALESIGKQIAEGLFGDFGSTGAGSKGSGFAAIFGSLFGGGRANGGPVSGNRIYEVGEGNRPELLSSGGRQFLIPGNNGKVTPVGAGRGGIIQNISFNLPGRYDMRTQAQMASDTQRAGQRALARGTA